MAIFDENDQYFMDKLQEIVPEVASFLFSWGKRFRLIFEVD